MLRESSIAFDYPIDIRALVDPATDPGTPGGRVILDFVVAVLTYEALDRHHDAMVETVGAEGLVDAAAVFGNFEMMNRVAEGTGIPVPAAAVDREADTVSTLGLEPMRKH